ncbi:MAG: response regulator [Hyphomicrobiales bacterium]|nr:response regulator [Hyphomicrobiales bacterium]
MSIAREITPQLPSLRRFARLIAGSQASGDAHVVATLEALIADPDAFPRDVPCRQALYQVFLKLWSSADPEAHHALPSSPPAAERNLGAITPLPRQAFLLRTVEGFTLEEVAAILGLPGAGVERLLDQAGREIAEQVATEVLIIEDEPIIALDIEAMVQDLGHTVTGVARTRKEAIESVQQRRPGLVLADIHLADGSSGLDAVNEILDSINLPVIFITAYPERLLTGERPEPAFLVTKPFQADTVRATISQALFFDRRAERQVLH